MKSAGHGDREEGYAVVVAHVTFTPLCHPVRNPFLAIPTNRPAMV